MTNLLNKIDTIFASLGARFWIWFGILATLSFYGFINHVYMMGWPSHDVTLTTVDSDVYLRLTKIREFIQDGNLFNHNIFATNAPYGGVETPWTRPVDFIVSFIYQFTSSDLSINKRLLLSAVWYPIIIGGLLIYVMGKAAETGFESVHKLVIVILCLIGYLLNSNEDSYFMVGNVDHHSLQTLLWVTSIWLLLSSPSTYRSIGLGLALGTWVWISPEALPFIFAINLIQGIESIFKPAQARYAIISSLSITATSLIGLFIETPVDKIFVSPSYDTISIVHVILFTFCTAGFFALSFIVKHFEEIQKRLICAIGTATILAASYFVLFPKFIKGPMANASPYVFDHFLPRISEATPLLNNSANVIVTSLFLPLFAVAISLIVYKKHPKLLTLLILSLIMTLFQLKWYYYLESISIITIAKLLPSLTQWSKSFIRIKKQTFKNIIIHPFTIIIAICIVTALVIRIIPTHGNKEADNSSRCQLAGFYLIESGQLQKTLGDKKITYESNILGNSGLSFFTPYHYVAGYYHREASYGMPDQNTIIESSSLDIVRPLLKERGVNVMMICPMGGKSWINQYFSKKPAPSRDWVQIKNDFTYPQKMIAPVKPILLLMEP